MCIYVLYYMCMCTIRAVFILAGVRLCTNVNLQLCTEHKKPGCRNTRVNKNENIKTNILYTIYIRFEPALYTLMSQTIYILLTTGIQTLHIQGLRIFSMYST
jgi:hypothetical protein